MKCSKCGYERQSRDDVFVPISECPACGVVYAKHDPAMESDTTVTAIPSPHLKPSPVDAISLRKARERVEKRLRERRGTRVPDDRHAQTLKLAKRLTSEQLRIRQDEWKQTHADKQTEQPKIEDGGPEEHIQETKALVEQDVEMDFTDPPFVAMREETPLDLETAQPDIIETLPESEGAIPAAHIAATALQHQHKAGLTRFLPVVAWLMLCAGVIGAFLSWTTIGDVEAGVRIPIPESVNTLPLGLLLGYAYLATGVLGFAFFWVSSLISVQLKDIRRLLTSENKGEDKAQDLETEQ